jgi:hypothetical protein
VQGRPGPDEKIAAWPHRELASSPFQTHGKVV